MFDLPGMLLAFLGYTIFPTGIVLLKAGAPWLGWKGPKDRVFYKALVLWGVGFLLYNLALVPNGMASRTLPPHIISAISGWGIIVIITLSYLFLKEKIHRSDVLFSILIVASIFLVGFLEKPVPVERIVLPAFYILLGIPFLLLVPALMKSTGDKLKTILYSVFAGCIAGFSLVIMNVLIKERGYDFLLYFNTPYPYLFAGSGVFAFVALQLAMKKGDMMLIGPLQNSFIIIYPVICSYFVFGSRLGLVQIVAMMVIVVCGIGIMRKH